MITEADFPAIVWTDLFNEAWQGTAVEQRERWKILHRRRIQLSVETVLAEAGTYHQLGLRTAKLLRSEWVLRAAWNTVTGSRLPL